MAQTTPCMGTVAEEMSPCTPRKWSLGEDGCDVGLRGFGTKSLRSPWHGHGQFSDDVISTAAPSPALTCLSEPFSPHWRGRPAARSFDDTQSYYMLPSNLGIDGKLESPVSLVSPPEQPRAQTGQTPREGSPPPITPRDRIIIRDPARSPPPAPRPTRRIGGSTEPAVWWPPPLVWPPPAPGLLSP
jgi:hypothetical protein